MNPTGMKRSHPETVAFSLQLCKAADGTDTTQLAFNYTGHFQFTGALLVRDIRDGNTICD